MKPILFGPNETQFASNGLGRIDALSCIVTEARNGQYDLEMEVSIEDDHYADIQEGRILYVRHDETVDKQPFDIYSISRPLNGIVTVFANHISYRTQGITVMPFSENGIGLAMQGLKTNSVGDNSFTLWTDKVSTGEYNVKSPRTLRSLLGGEEGSILDVFGSGEYEWDKFSIKLHSRRGSDSGVVVRYGKDITELNKTTTTDGYWTGVVPFWRGNRSSEGAEGTSYSEVTVTLPEKSIIAAGATAYPHQVIIPLDLSGSFSEEPTEEQLRQKATQYVNNNAPSALPTSIEFSFVNTAELEEYEGFAALQRLKLCDTVSVEYTKLGVSNTAKIVETQFDVLAERYISLKVGDVAPNLTNTLEAETKQSIADVQNSLQSEFERTIAEQTALITGGNGGNVVIRKDANKKPYEILIMDDEDADEATNVLRINMNGIGFSNSGINGPYSTAWTLDGRFSADYIQTGRLNASLIQTGSLNADYIKGGTLKLGGSNNINGKLEVFDANGTRVGYWDNTGASIQGSLTNSSASGLNAVTIANGGITGINGSQVIFRSDGFDYTQQIEFLVHELFLSVSDIYVTQTRNGNQAYRGITQDISLEDANSGLIYNMHFVNGLLVSQV